MNRSLFHYSGEYSLFAWTTFETIAVSFFLPRLDGTNSSFEYHNKHQTITRSFSLEYIGRKKKKKKTLWAKQNKPKRSNLFFSDPSFPL